MFTAIIYDGSLATDVCDSTMHNLDLFRVESLEIADTRGDTATSNTPIRDKLLQQLTVVEQRLHVSLHVLFGHVLFFRVSEECSKRATQALLDVTAHIQMVLRISLELLDLFVCVLLGFLTKRRSDPCRLSDECRQAFDRVENCWKDLDSR